MKQYWGFNSTVLLQFSSEPIWYHHKTKVKVTFIYAWRHPCIIIPDTLLLFSCFCRFFCLLFKIGLVSCLLTSLKPIEIGTPVIYSAVLTGVLVIGNRSKISRGIGSCALHTMLTANVVENWCHKFRAQCLVLLHSFQQLCTSKIDFSLKISVKFCSACDSALSDFEDTYFSV